MKNRILLIVTGCVLIAAFLLGATGIVKVGKGAEIQEEEKEDRMIGVYLTTEDLGNENVYATLEKSSDGSVETYTFDTEKGIQAFMAEYTSKNGNKFIAYSGDARLQTAPSIGKTPDFIGPSGSDTGSGNGQIDTSGNINVGTELSGTENSDRSSLYRYYSHAVEMKGVVFLTGYESIIIVINPVYQDAEGRVYAKHGTAMRVGNREFGNASVCNEQNMPVKDGDTEKSNYFRIDITFETVDLANDLNVLQYNASRELISETKYTLSDFPEEFKPLSDTEYMILETVTEKGTDRELLTKDDKYMRAVADHSDGIGQRKTCYITWGK